MSTVTIRDVARAAGVGVATVSRVLNDHPSVSNRTRARVQAAIESLNYRPNPYAQRLSLTKTHVVAVIAPYFSTPSCVERLQGIETALAARNYDFMLHNVETVERFDYYTRHIPRRHAVDGVIIITLAPADHDIQRLRAQRIPIVLVDRVHPELVYVATDDVAGAEQATRYLIELGHRRIAFISDNMQDPFDLTSAEKRFRGFRNALKTAGIPSLPHYQCHGKRANKSARQLARILLSGAQPPTAIVASGDTQALGILQAAQEMGITVPQQLSVIGYDDIAAAEYVGLTTVHQPLRKSGRLGAESLLRMIDDRSRIPSSVILPTEIVVRRTTAAPAPKPSVA